MLKLLRRSTGRSLSQRRFVFLLPEAQGEFDGELVPAISLNVTPALA